MKTTIMTLDEIKQLLAKLDIRTLTDTMEKGFVAYSEGKATVPPVGHLLFDSPPGDAHIKYGFIQADNVFVIKVATSFYENPQHGLPSSNGIVLVFSQKTGELLSVLLDEGHLTQIRTAIAGAVVAKRLAPTHVHAIGIAGTGTQARLQLEYLRTVIDCSRVYVYGRSDQGLAAYVNDMSAQGFEVTPTKSIDDILAHCNYIVTTTPSTEPLIAAASVPAGTHITAMGADTEGKQELDPAILQKADIVLVDSKSQCLDHGEALYAVRQKLITPDKLIELGDFIKNNSHRESDTQITVADLTGVAVQDIQIAKLIYASSGPAQADNHPLST